MIFLAIGIFAYVLYPPAVVWLALTWASIYLFTFTLQIFQELSN